MNEFRYEILDALRAGPARSHIIAERLVRDRDLVNACLRGMVECELVRSVSHGCYRLTARGEKVLSTRDVREAAVRGGTSKCCASCKRTQPMAEFGSLKTCWTCRESKRRPPKPKPAPPRFADMPAFTTGHLSPVLGLRWVA